MYQIYNLFICRGKPIPYEGSTKDILDFKGNPWKRKTFTAY